MEHALELGKAYCTGTVYLTVPQRLGTIQAWDLKLNPIEHHSNQTFSHDKEKVTLSRMRYPNCGRV